MSLLSRESRLETHIRRQVFFVHIASVRRSSDTFNPTHRNKSPGDENKPPGNANEIEIDPVID